MNSEINNHKSQTLIILPGWGGSHETWVDFVALAKEQFEEVIMIDLPCFGSEPCPSKVWGVEEYSHFVEEKIQALKKQGDLSISLRSTRDNVILLGHSFGGAVAVQLVANNPDITDKLILSGAAIIRPKRYIKRLLFGTAAKFGTLVLGILPFRRLKEAAKKVLYKISGSSDGEDVLGIKKQIFQKVIRQDLKHLLPQIKTPTCVIQGTQDAYVPYRHGVTISQTIPHASFVSIEGGTHGLHQKRTDELLAAIIEFCTQT